MGRSRYVVRVKDFTPAVKAAFEKAKTNAADKMGKSAKKYAQSIVPVRTGALRDSIDYRVENGGFILFTDKEYGIYVELGTYKMAARPYMRPAMQEHTNEYLAEAKAEFTNATITGSGKTMFY